MNEKSLEKNLANLERELINLQTAHEIGLGSVKYWEYSENGRIIELEYVYAVIVLINVAAGERLNPIIDFYADLNADFREIVKSNIYPNRYAFIMMTLDRGAQSILWKMVSTSKLDYHYGNSSQEAEDWVGEDL